MKADKYGTPAEYLRKKMGWMPAKQRKEEGLPKDTVCRNCTHFWVKSGKNREGGLGIYYYCGAPGTGEKGLATRQSASCARWEVKQ